MWPTVSLNSFLLSCGHRGLEFPIFFLSVIFKVEVANFNILIMHLQTRSPQKGRASLSTRYEF